ncbi:MAG: cell division protein FtsB [Gammaproteobacteria bacterium]|nr:MAG: cell division protein FtsB [Gammaproteobacteria bacterium]
MFKKILNSTLRLTLVIIALAVLVVLNFYVWNKDHQQEEQIQALQKQLAIQRQENNVLSQSNTELRQKIDSLKQGSTEMIEEEARSGFGMVGEGETFYHFEGKKPKD